MNVLGIETSCDETSAAVVTDGPRLLGQIVLSQSRLHGPFGGVVPEIASRSHVENLTRVVDECLRQSGVEKGDIFAVAAASRPGLIGALLVGVTTAKALAWAWGRPFLGIDHLEAHLEAPLLSGRKIELPYLGVVLSGGHTDLYEVKAQGRSRIGATQDDAVGEAFDKVASILGLGYPGGPRVEKLARDGDPEAVNLPRTLLGPDSLDFSFSGIKTAVLYAWRGQNARSPGPVPEAPPAADLAASFQATVAEILTEKIRRALRRTGLRRVVFGGGVTANRYLRTRLATELDEVAEEIVFPPPEFSTDNGAMIAALALSRVLRGEFDGWDLEATST